jgi:hypothetical protein
VVTVVLVTLLPVSRDQALVVVQQVQRVTVQLQVLIRQAVLVPVRGLMERHDKRQVARALVIILLVSRALIMAVVHQAVKRTPLLIA